MSDAVHRYTQPPSKVLHVRNLPYEATESELHELCAPFGKLVQAKLGVGANKNQAFVEFADVHSAINMVSFYANSDEPAKVRGKIVYMQYSTRQEIVNNRGCGDAPSNVLLVTLEGLSGNPITIETLHIVFSAFGFVHKIATFEKSAGFQALIKYGDSDTARAVKDALDGRHIPRHLITDHPNPPLLRISYSQHQDLNVKFQSHRSRDYTNPSLPVAPHAQDGGGFHQHMGPGAVPGSTMPSSSNPTEGNVLLCTIENQEFPVTVEALHQVFGYYGMVQKIAIFEKNGSWQALIQYPDQMSAATAKTNLEGHAVYDGGFNRLRISYSVHHDLNVKAYNQRSRDFTIPQPGEPGYAPHTPFHPMDNGMFSKPLPPLLPTHPGTLPHEDVIVTGFDYEHAHEEVARAAKAALNGPVLHSTQDGFNPTPGGPIGGPQLGQPPLGPQGPHPRPLDMGPLPHSDVLNGRPPHRPPQIAGPPVRLPQHGPPMGQGPPRLSAPTGGPGQVGQFQLPQASPYLQQGPPLMGRTPPGHMPNVGPLPHGRMPSQGPGPQGQRPAVYGLAMPMGPQGPGMPHREPWV